MTIAETSIASTPPPAAASPADANTVQAMQLVRCIEHLAQLASHAEGVMRNLHTSIVATGRRVHQLGARVDLIAHQLEPQASAKLRVCFENADRAAKNEKGLRVYPDVISSIFAKPGAVPWRMPRTGGDTASGQLGPVSVFGHLTPSTRGPAINKLYFQCTAPPALQLLDKYRAEEANSQVVSAAQNCMSRYSYPGFFADEWRKLMDKEDEERKRKKRARRGHRSGRIKSAQPTSASGKAAGGAVDKSVPEADTSIVPAPSLPDGALETPVAVEATDLPLTPTAEAGEAHLSGAFPPPPPPIPSVHDPHRTGGTAWSDTAAEFSPLDKFPPPPPPPMFSDDVALPPPPPPLPSDDIFNVVSLSPPPTMGFYSLESNQGAAPPAGLAAQESSLPPPPPPPPPAIGDPHVAVRGPPPAPEIASPSSPSAPSLAALVAQAPRLRATTTRSVAERAPPPATGRDGLLSSIRAGGFQLRKVEPAPARAANPAGKRPAPAQGNDVASILMRRAAIEMSDSEDEEDDGDDGDNEW